MGARGEGEEGERDFEVVTVVIEEQDLSVTKANERENETKSNQSQIQNQRAFLLASSCMSSEENQPVGVSDENENNSNGLVEMIEVDAFVEADEDSNTEKEGEHRGVYAKEEKFDGGVVSKVFNRIK